MKKLLVVFAVVLTQSLVFASGSFAQRGIM